jgi:hypothetical protein
MIIQQGKMEKQIVVGKEISPGLYYFLVYTQNKLIGLKPFVLL